MANANHISTFKRTLASRPPWLWAGLLFFLLGACKPDKSSELPPAGPSPVSIDITHFPPMPLEADKELTAERIALGKKLFFDPILSRDYTISCATCHLTNLAFTDGVPVAVGIEGRKHFRNSPTLFNVAWQPYLFMDGGNPSLESQVLGPVEEHVEMDLPFPDALARVVNHPEYPDLFQEAFDADPNPYTLTTALATFQRALVSYDSPFDRYRYHGESEALSAAAKRGLALFESAKLNCSACHQFPLTTNFAFENNGLKADYQADPGRARVTNNLADDEGKFKVATLRNIALTGPYMHDGSLVSLEEVIEHYASGGSQHRLQSNLVQGFSISDQEKADLIAFLHSLTDTSSYHLYVK